MAFKEGQSGNKNGRPKNAKGKKTIDSIKRIEYVLSLLEPTIEGDIKRLRPNERVKLWNDLQEYIRPKLARTEHTGKGGKELKAPIINVIGAADSKPE